MASRTTKIFRDPLYNYISIDRERDGWLLEILDCPEMQRLRRIHQLGVSYLTYPGADHNRLAHSLGVVHLMQQALHHLERVSKDVAESARHPLLACALLHDVGHGPFSHVSEVCLDADHEDWSRKIVLNPDSKINRILTKYGPYLPQTVADLVEKNNRKHPPWQKALLSSQLDVDRMDYLRRDSLFTGAGYGHFDHFRILNTFDLYYGEKAHDLVWTEKSSLAIEEYVFARYYMYHNVYLHKTTRGFEVLLQAMWRRARKLANEGNEAVLIPVLRDFWKAADPTVGQYLRIEEFSMLQQIQEWSDQRDKPLADLARRFMNRDRFVVVEPPAPEDPLAPDHSKWEAALRAAVERAGVGPAECYCLRDDLKGKYHRPYFPEKEGNEQSSRNAIRILTGDNRPTEISSLLPRLKSVTEKAGVGQPPGEKGKPDDPPDTIRYYVPAEVRDKVRKLRAAWPTK